MVLKLAFAIINFREGLTFSKASPSKTKCQQRLINNDVQHLNIPDICQIKYNDFWPVKVKCIITLVKGVFELQFDKGKATI